MRVSSSDARSSFFRCYPNLRPLRSGGCPVSLEVDRAHADHNQRLVLDVRGAHGRFAKIDEQELGLGPRCQRDRALAAEAGAISSADHDVAQRDLSFHDVQPRASAGAQFMNHVLAAV